MVKGTASFGNKSKSKTHIRCRRCGKHSYHVHDKKCAFCGFGRTEKLRNYLWSRR